MFFTNIKHYWEFTDNVFDTSDQKQSLYVNKRTKCCQMLSKIPVYMWTGPAVTPYSVILQVFYLNLFHTTNLDNLEDFE